MKLVDAGKLRLDDRVDTYVEGLHPQTAAATLRQLLSHSAGVVRDGVDAGQWQMRRPFLDVAELRAALAQAPVLDANTRFKYSNHGFGLLGLVIERVTGEAYGSWIAREIVAAAGLQSTWPDAPPVTAKLAHGHGARALLGTRFEIDNAVSTNALAAATGFTSNARDLTSFFRQLSPAAQNSWLGVSARREMTRRQWRVPDMAVERHYGLGTIHGGDGEWAWFGHSGAFPGCFSHTIVLPSHDVTISVIVNAFEVSPLVLVDGLVAIMRAFREGGAPSAATARWSGRWWSVAGATDLVPLRDKVLVVAAAQANPLLDAVELADVNETSARIAKAGGFLSYGEPARLVSDASGNPVEFWLGGTKLLPETTFAAEVQQRFLNKAS